MGVEVRGVSATAKAREITLPIRPGQTDKIGAAYLLLNPVIFKFVLRRVSLDYEAAEQITGDVFAKLIEEVGKEKGPRRNLPSYLFQTASNLITDRQRRNRKEDDSTEIADREAFGLRSPKHGPRIEELVTDKNDLQRIYKIAERMSQDVRHALFFYMMDFSIKETAEIMRIEPNYVKVLRNRAKEFVKRELSRSDSQ